MSNGHDMTVQQKNWSPRMVKLTAIGNREVSHGEPTATYVDPYYIALAVRSIGSWNVMYSQGRNEPTECTTVWLRDGCPANILVLESPEEVALLRDRALEVPVQLHEIK